MKLSFENFKNEKTKNSGSMHGKQLQKPNGRGLFKALCKSRRQRHRSL
jgi:hypothetical protein